jgi:hypothetical protein
MNSKPGFDYELCKNVLHFAQHYNKKQKNICLKRVMKLSSILQFHNELPAFCCHVSNPSGGIGFWFYTNVKVLYADRYFLSAAGNITHPLF